MNEDMSEMFKNFSQMMNGEQEMPENIKNILNSMSNVNTNNTENNNDTQTSEDTRTNSGNFNGFGNIDMNTIIKMQQIMNSINDKQNDSRTNLLLSLKPYLKESRKSKVDQYIQLMKMEKIFEVMNPLGNMGGGNKNAFSNRGVRMGLTSFASSRLLPLPWLSSL